MARNSKEHPMGLVPDDELLTRGEAGGYTSEIVWRKQMLLESRRQTLLLTEIRDHFKSWAVEE
ncbi:hypothetical protein AB0M83_19780 [Amycolatopsis sp. NPDC051106]|uniref:hypothetical protein n=2 Tax=unclassified Amycolatopsis TaxID=2618356 RepID=UPI003430567C